VRFEWISKIISPPFLAERKNDEATSIDHDVLENEGHTSAAVSACKQGGRISGDASIHCRRSHAQFFKRLPQILDESLVGIERFFVHGEYAFVISIPAHGITALAKEVARNSVEMQRKYILRG